MKKISLIPLVGIIYFTINGGTFELEELVSSTGPGLGLLLLIATRLLWSLPVALMVSEENEAWLGGLDHSPDMVSYIRACVGASEA